MDAEIVSNKIFEYIDSLAQKLGVATEHVMIIYTKQSYVYAINNLMKFSICMIISYIITKLIFFLHRQGKDRNKEFLDEQGSRGGIYICMFILSFICVIAIALGVDNLTIGLGQIVNPEYYALKDIANLIKK